MSGIISAPQFNEYFPETLEAAPNSSVYRGFVTAIYEIGCLAGALFILWCGDSLGRRRSVCPTTHRPANAMLTDSR